jgi:hypothetical protein
MPPRSAIEIAIDAMSAVATTAERLRDGVN